MTEHKGGARTLHTIGAAEARLNRGRGVGKRANILWGPRYQQSGFTLVEVLVALVIFGVIAASVLKTMQDSVRQQIAMEERLAANWVAQQALAELRLRSPWPPLGDKSEQVSIGEREWLVTARVEATSEERMRHITIEVAHPDAENPTITLDAWAAMEE